MHTKGGYVSALLIQHHDTHTRHMIVALPSWHEGLERLGLSTLQHHKSGVRNRNTNIAQLHEHDLQSDPYECISQRCQLRSLHSPSLLRVSGKSSLFHTQRPDHDAAFEPYLTATALRKTDQDPNVSTENQATEDGLETPDGQVEKNIGTKIHGMGAADRTAHTPLRSLKRVHMLRNRSANEMSLLSNLSPRLL